MNPPFRLLAEIGQRQGSPAAAAIYVGRSTVAELFAEQKLEFPSSLSHTDESIADLSKPIGPEDGDAYSSSTKEAIEHIVDSQPLHFVDC